VIIVTQMHGQS